MTSPVFVLARQQRTGAFVNNDANILRSGFDFEGTASPISYEPHKAGGTIPPLENSRAIPPRIHMLGGSSSGQASTGRGALSANRPAP
jgi:hypothetical protein